MVSNIFYFHPYVGKIPILTNIFQMGWNHQLVVFPGKIFGINIFPRLAIIGPQYLLGLKASINVELSKQKKTCGFSHNITTPLKKLKMEYTTPTQPPPCLKSVVIIHNPGHFHSCHVHHWGTTRSKTLSSHCHLHRLGHVVDGFPVPGSWNI